MTAPPDLDRELAFQWGHVERHMHEAKRYDAEHRRCDAMRQREIAGGFLRTINALLGFPAT